MEARGTFHFPPLSIDVHYIYSITCLLVDLKELALQVTTDPDHKFDLALQLDDLDSALEIARITPENEAETKWKAVGDRALAVWRFDLARECFERAGDLSALMLLLLAVGDRNGLTKLAEKAGESFRFCIHVWYSDKILTFFS